MLYENDYQPMDTYLYKPDLYKVRIAYNEWSDQNRCVICVCVFQNIFSFSLELSMAVQFEFNKRQKDCLWKQRTHNRLENGSLGFFIVVPLLYAHPSSL